MGFVIDTRRGGGRLTLQREVLLEGELLEGGHELLVEDVVDALAPRLAAVQMVLEVVVEVAAHLEDRVQLGLQRGKGEGVREGGLGGSLGLHGFRHEGFRFCD